MTRLVDHHGAGKDEHVVLRLEIVRPRHVYGKPMVKEGEQLLLHHRGDLAIAMDLVRGRELEQLLTDERQLGPRQILERELTTEAERLAVDEVDLTALIVADVVVVAPRQELLLQHVAHGRSSWW